MQLGPSWPQVLAQSEVVCLGESMALLVPVSTRRLAEGDRMRVRFGGAESNVACNLARLGVRSRWVSRVGDDEFGRLLLEHLRRAGVDTSAVTVDPVRPTGLYVKELGAAGTRMRYYRRGSAASAMSPDDVDRLDLSQTSLLHVTGITAALSSTCRALMQQVLTAPQRRVPVSLDVNWRRQLWDSDGPQVLLELARRADIVFVGADEAEDLWGVSDPGEIAALLGGPATLVVKQAEAGATLVTAAGTVFAPALTVDVVEPVGAGDAFAAGFLAGTLSGLADTVRLRLGHVVAATALRTHGDLGELPDLGLVATLVHADDRTWRRTVFDAVFDADVMGR